jgi:hypothetical protein
MDVKVETVAESQALPIERGDKPFDGGGKPVAVEAILVPAIDVGEVEKRDCRVHRDVKIGKIDLEDVPRWIELYVWREHRVELVGDAVGLGGGHCSDWNVRLHAVDINGRRIMTPAREWRDRCAGDGDVGRHAGILEDLTHPEATEVVRPDDNRLAVLDGVSEFVREVLMSVGRDDEKDDVPPSDSLGHARRRRIGFNLGETARAPLDFDSAGVGNRADLVATAPDNRYVASLEAEEPGERMSLAPRAEYRDAKGVRLCVFTFIGCSCHTRCSHGVH